MHRVERADVEAWSLEERSRVARLLDELVERPNVRRPPKQRVLVLAATWIGAVVLIPWSVFLSNALPKAYSVRAWNVVWVGYDLALAVCLGATGWWVLHRRQVAVLGLAVTTTLLLADTWFDVCLAWNTPDEKWAVLSALVEVPVALLLAVSALRMLNQTSHVVRQLRGHLDGPNSVWRQPMVTVPPQP